MADSPGTPAFNCLTIQTGPLQDKLAEVLGRQIDDKDVTEACAAGLLSDASEWLILKLVDKFAPQPGAVEPRRGQNPAQCQNESGTSREGACPALHMAGHPVPTVGSTPLVGGFAGLEGIKSLARGTDAAGVFVYLPSGRSKVLRRPRPLV